MSIRIASAAVVAASVASVASAGMTEFIFPLGGDQEVPANGTSASGTGSLVFNSTADTFDIDIFIQGIALGDLLGVGPNSTPIHIHNAPAGSNGGIAVDLGTISSFFDDAGGIRFLAFDVPIGAQEANLFNGDLYVNVHTTSFGGGEVRGQIVPAPGAVALLGLGGLAAVRRRR